MTDKSPKDLLEGGSLTKWGESTDQEPILSRMRSTKRKNPPTLMNTLRKSKPKSSNIIDRAAEWEKLGGTTDTTQRTTYAYGSTELTSAVEMPSLVCLGASQPRDDKGENLESQKLKDEERNIASQMNDNETGKQGTEQDGKEKDDDKVEKTFQEEIVQKDDQEKQNTSSDREDQGGHKDPNDLPDNGPDPEPTAFEPHPWSGYSNLACYYRARHYEARDFYYQRRPYHCRRICEELLTRPYLPRHLRCQTLLLIATTYQYHVAKRFLLEALEVCGAIDSSKPTPFAQLLREATNSMLVQLESKIPSKDLFNEKGQYVGPHLLDDEEAFAAERTIMEDMSSDDDLSSDNASDSEDIIEDDIHMEQTIIESIKELKITIAPLQAPSSLSEDARKAGWMPASEYVPSVEDLRGKWEQVPPTDTEERKEYIKKSLADHDAMTLALLESSQRTLHRDLAEAATKEEIARREELIEASNRLSKNSKKLARLVKLWKMMEHAENSSL